jgi:hypothetical protein
MNYDEMLLIAELLRQNLEVIEITLENLTCTVLTKALVCQVRSHEYRLIGRLQLTLVGGTQSIISVKNIDGHPGIMHSSGNTPESSSICFGNYGSIQTLLQSEVPPWKRIVSRLIKFCQAVNLGDSRGSSKESLFPSLSRSEGERYSAINKVRTIVLPAILLLDLRGNVNRNHRFRYQNTEFSFADFFAKVKGNRGILKMCFPQGVIYDESTLLISENVAWCMRELNSGRTQSTQIRKDYTVKDFVNILDFRGMDLTLTFVDGVMASQLLQSLQVGSPRWKHMLRQCQFDESTVFENANRSTLLQHRVVSENEIRTISPSESWRFWVVQNDGKFLSLASFVTKLTYQQQMNLMGFTYGWNAVQEPLASEGSRDFRKSYISKFTVGEHLLLFKERFRRRGVNSSQLGHAAMVQEKAIKFNEKSPFFDDVLKQRKVIEFLTSLHS